MKNAIKLIILIQTQPQPGKSNEQIDLYNKIKPLVLAEEGCLSYQMSRVAGSDVKFVLIERWKSKGDLALHDETPHMKEADSISPSFRTGPATVIELIDL
ncbi:MAG: quinol monooxygenase YgiN [Candidatus Endobugula sp.]|jgi:quinol monooxygenase YgiN